MNSLLQGNKVFLRALEPEDIDVLYKWENDTEVWRVSNALAPYSKYILRQFIENQRHDIYETKQLRLVIAALEDGRPVGAIDLFDFDPVNLRAGVGILIYDKQDRGHGYASQAIELLKNYSFEVLKLHQLYANIESDNDSSLALFRRVGFTDAGLKKEWLADGDCFRDEYLLQFINKK